MSSMNSEALSIKSDNDKIDKFIAKHKNFILSCAYKTVHRYITDSDEEYAIALLAFHEAVERYEETKGEFMPFAALVIRRRLTDFLRSSSNEIPVQPDRFDDRIEDEDASVVEKSVSGKIIDLALYQSRVDDEREATLEEIAEAQELLSAYGFSFFDLSDSSPKSAKTKELCRDAVVCLLTNESIFEKMRSSKTLPIKEIIDRTDLPRKKIERHRKYIIAAAELLSGDFPHLNEYLREIRLAVRSSLEAHTQ